MVGVSIKAVYLALFVAPLIAPFIHPIPLSSTINHTSNLTLLLGKVLPCNPQTLPTPLELETQ
jgi:hypothetical protein